MKLTFSPYNLQLTHPFGVAGHTRTFTPTVRVFIENDGHIGYGEASLPPYLYETQASVMAFLEKINLSEFDLLSDFEAILQHVQHFSVGNYAAKAAIDIALHDIYGKLTQKSVSEIYGIHSATMPLAAFTIGIDTPEVMQQKVLECVDFELLKIKLGSLDDKAIINAIREVSSKPLIVDVNQGWTSLPQAMDMIDFLANKNVLLLEQPMAKSDLKSHQFLSKNSPIPIYADESLQTLADFEAIKDSFNGINIKLMKCGGISQALKLIKLAHTASMPILMGSMNESSCAVMAAAHLAPLCTYADLDGPWMIQNNPYEKPNIENGRMLIGVEHGLGIVLI